MLANQIKKLRSHLGISQAKLAETLGIRQSTVAMWECGKNKPAYDMLIKISELFGVGIGELSGEDSMFTRIPVLGKVQAGVPTSAVEDVIDYVEISSELNRSGEFFALTIRGKSMEPRFCEGDIVIVRRQSCVENGEIAIVLVNNEDATCKKFYRHNDGISLVSLNSDFAPMFFAADELENTKIEIIGKVCELRAKF